MVRCWRFLVLLSADANVFFANKNGFRRAVLNFFKLESIAIVFRIRMALAVEKRTITKLWIIGAAPVAGAVAGIIVVDTHRVIADGPRQCHGRIALGLAY